MESIFVQIASYRDPELIPTIENLLEQAIYPERLKICIAHQHSPEDEWDTLDPYVEDPRFVIIDIPHFESHGVCWARNQVQQYYNDETYTLQLDSHHRFVKGWDVICIRMLKNLQDKGHPKPLLTSYIPSYDPANDPEGRVEVPWAMQFDRFIPEGPIFFLPYYLEKGLKEPIPARFYSAHFTFTLGIFCKEVPHDPRLYFHGEEITLAVRAYTWGYDLFHPHTVIAWHEYTRKGRKKHWDDDARWVSKNMIAHARVRQLLGVDGEVCTPCNMNTFIGFNIGGKRTLKEYEIYAGIRFKDRSITDRCRHNFVPPGFKEDHFYPLFKYPLELNKKHFPWDDYEYAVISFINQGGEEAYRDKLTKEEIKAFKEGKDEVWKVWRSYNGVTPKQWSVWPFSSTKGWGEKSVYNI